MSVSVPLSRRPDWIKARAPMGERYEALQRLMRDHGLHTVCEEARCPNVGDCWNRGTATFMILGDVCTRACGFCAVKTGLPDAPPDPEEPRRVADAVARMALRHAVVTSVNRDDQKDGGAWSFAACIREIRARTPACAVEVLIPDFKGD
jgi:lipoyl synthase